ncbi:CRTAC1 family protein [Actibacterium lipolyticum]|nr:CRTAC1 family protein [Actibacterium lipolyticum]
MRLNTSIILALMAGAAQADPAFVERGAQLGIDHQYVGGWEHFVGGGIAAFDCDGDALPELYAAGGQAPAALLRNSSQRGGTLSFQQNTPVSLALTGVIGAYPLDVDSDGWQDLFVLRVGENQLLKGGPDCSFAPFPNALGLSGGDKWSTAFSAAWEDGNDLPTLAIGNYVDRHNPEGPFQTCDTNELLRPKGRGYGAPVDLSPGYCALSMLFSDWGRTGRADLRVSNDRHYYVKGGQEQMWAMQPSPRLYGEGDGWRRYMLWGMGIASRDISGDGLPEVYLSSMGDQKLQMLADGATGPDFRDATFEKGTTAHRPHMGGDGRPSTGWHVAFGDVQNDGRDDIFIAKGNVEQMPGSAMKDPNNLLLQLDDGRFAEGGGDAGVASMARSRGAALVDLNLDGRLDLAVVNRRAPVEVYENVTSDAGQWLLLSLRQPAPNVDAIGAWLEVKTETGVQSRELTVGGGHAGGTAGFQHFGLGDQAEAQVRVIWPGGVVSDWATVQAGQVLTLSPDGASLSVTAR